MTTKIFIDGSAGTTGLRIRELLAERRDIELVTVADALRKDPDARRETLLAADIAILCLPDDAAREVAAWAEGGDTRLLDASTAHRVAGDWVYGLPELQPDQRDKIRNAGLVSNPGCYATALILLTRPLIDAGVIPVESALVVHALSGYSGGGRALIERWQDPKGGLKSLPYEAPYALDLLHKHIPEMMKYSGLATEPQFLPAVGPFYSGMRLQIPLHAALLDNPAAGTRIREVLEQRYRGEPFVKVAPPTGAGQYNETSFDPEGCNGTNRIELRVLPHASGHVLLMAILDNLGKGAGGMAVQNLNLMIGVPEETGLVQ